MTLFAFGEDLNHHSSPSSFTFTSYTYDRYGSRTSRITRNRKGEIVSKENRAYDRYGRLSETIAGFGAKVTYSYDSKGRLARQTVDGSPIDYEYTRRGQLAGKYLGGKLKPDATVEYEYAKNGQIVARTANGVRQTYEYDFKGQLLAVKEGEEYVERYAYDKAGNMVKKVVRGSRFVVRDGVECVTRDGEYKTTTFTFDDANQLVSSTCDGITTRYEYDAAGRLVREGNRTYTYGYLDKVMSVRFDRSSANSSTSQPLNSSTVYTYTYHPDGQLATADYGKDGSEDFTWDGLALIQRGNEHFINEPHVGGGNPVVSSKGTSYFNDMLGTTVGAKSGKTYSAATLSAFGEDLTVNAAGDSSHSPFPVPHSPFFTGKPHVAGLGHAFLMRNYRSDLGKWQTADPMGYPDGWNQLAYCNNGVTSAVDLWGAYAKDTMYEISAETVASINGNGDKACGDYTADGWRVKYKTDNSLFYYCNIQTPAPDVETIYFATGKLVTTTTSVYADIYQGGYFLAMMTKSECLKRAQNAGWELGKGLLLILGTVISMTEAGGDVSLTDMLSAWEGNEIRVRIGDKYKLIESQALIDRSVKIEWFPNWE